MRSEPSTGVSSSATDDSPATSLEGTSSETFSESSIQFQKWVDATDRRVQKQRRPFQ
eukprot:CAMPEP_0178434178 /NCGR_PEP_ID=MMETSP0689_2-20121128/33290_1 /TAXON_ID=160604 /ORGANISM="Amphidinium massartii, Strain CS-259" /LENGTH=56 /DNA_ID=CAMNT_0020056235 /DNA_START=59 /DNA_END=226 /DNA_ORIENTATION=+